MTVLTLQRIRRALALCLLLTATGPALAAGEVGAAPGPAATPTVLIFGLGERCAACVKLKQEIAKVKQLTGETVTFVDYLVQRDFAMVQRYRVELSPTLVFLDASGAEVSRHQGLLDAPQIQERLVALTLWAGTP